MADGSLFRKLEAGGNHEIIDNTSNGKLSFPSKRPATLSGSSIERMDGIRRTIPSGTGNSVDSLTIEGYSPLAAGDVLIV